MMRTPYRGFSLIELLIVITIIALLATIVLATLNSARERARDTSRVNDINQVVTALELYRADNGGTYPPSPASGSDRYFLATLADDLVPTYLPKIPVDPQAGSTNNGYRYCRPNGQEGAYQIVVKLEKNRTPQGVPNCTMRTLAPVSGTNCWTENGAPVFPYCD